MSRTLLIALALLAAAYADEYAFNQVDEMVSRIEVCLKGVPFSSFVNPAQNCKMEARWNVEYEGGAKETLADFVVDCLKGQRVDAAILSTAQECLTKSLAMDLKPALEEADYSGAQQDEINNRMRQCLSTIPETKYHTPASDCRNNAMLQASEGYPKESLVDFVIPCLNSKKIDAAVVAAAQTCIVAVLDEPLSS